MTAPERLTAVGAGLEQLYAQTDFQARLRTDPIRFPRRYTRHEDVEIAAVLASGFAFGRVTLFGPVLEGLFDRMDAQGGPRAYIDHFDPNVEGPALAPVVYRWVRGPDLVVLFGALRRVRAQHGGLEPLFGGGSARAALEGAATALEQEARAVAPSGSLSRGVRYFLSRPSTGSACKRWNMMLRWLVRPPTEGVDLGLWTCLRPADLVMPLDTHVMRIARFLGLIRTSTASWRVAEQLTAQLRRIDPLDPVRLDFAIAHLGISGACKGVRDPEVCSPCPLRKGCDAPPPSVRTVAGR
ncbi:MAG: TIGR02757 family protein [Alphaproteobacteria bacterium]|nr:TIGR02757 family protein [Alphaproteobacteria bacterium]